MQEYQIVKIARLYYQENLTFREIAGKMNISTATVSRMIARAKKEGIVHITINDPQKTVRDLEIQIEQKYNLKECIVVASADHMESVFERMAQAVGDVLDRLLRSSRTLGVSWGKTLQAVGTYLPQLDHPHVRVIPVVGAMGMIESGIYPNSISKAFAAKLRGASYQVNYPAFVDSPELKRSFENESSMLQIKQIWEQIDVALLSISGLDESSSVANLGIMPKEIREELVSKGVVGITNFNMIDEHGREIQTLEAERIINLGLDKLKKVPYVIVVAAGKTKICSIRSILNGKLPTILITDSNTAVGVIGR